MQSCQHYSSENMPIQKYISPSWAWHGHNRQSTWGDAKKNEFSSKTYRISVQGIHIHQISISLYILVYRQRKTKRTHSCTYHKTQKDGMEHSRLKTIK